MVGGDPVPIGRRVAYLRVRRKLSQQAFADRLGKSKSWVDKVERAVRRLERVTTIRDIAAVLGVEAATLLGRETQPAAVVERGRGVARIRAALSAYEMTRGYPAVSRPVVAVDRLVREVGHAWTTYQHARYPQLVEALPRLLGDVQRAYVRDPQAGRVAVVEAYRVTAALLVKLDEASLAWLAADRAMSAATGDPVLVAAAAVQLGQVLRTTGGRSVMLAAAYRIAPPDLDAGNPHELSLCGSLLVQAALMAARAGDEHDHHRTGFGPTAVETARTAAAVASGDGREAVAWHEKATSRDGWRWLPVEHRAAHLIDTARAHLQTDDPTHAARLLLQADSIAPAEVRHRPAARKVVAQAARAPDAPGMITQLALTLGVM